MRGNPDISLDHGIWRGVLGVDLRIPRQANSQDYWREAGAQRFRKTPAVPVKTDGTNWILPLADQIPVFIPLSTIFRPVG
jgi:hypothetical protein